MLDFAKRVIEMEYLPFAALAKKTNMNSAEYRPQKTSAQLRLERLDKTSSGAVRGYRIKGLNDISPGLEVPCRDTIKEIFDQLDAYHTKDREIPDHLQDQVNVVLPRPLIQAYALLSIDPLGRSAL